MGNYPATEVENEDRNVSAIDQELQEAYRKLDRGKKKLRTVKNLVYNETEDAVGSKLSMREEMGDANWFKIKEMENEIKFAKQELE